MKKCVFILPYFGKFNNYFGLFLKSCGKNTEYNWLILTDDKEKYNYPSNVKVIYSTFDEIKELFKNKIGFEISLSSPYKLCDFKPTYGLVFEEYIQEYEYWGHCDCDVIFGNLDKMLSPLLNEGYDKLFAAGHLTIYKNTAKNNRRFLLNYHGRNLAQEFLSVPEICWFDEDWKADNIHTMFLESDAKVFSEVLAFNPSGNHAYFVQRNYIPTEHRYVEERYKKALYAWVDGSVIRQTLDRNKLRKEEYLYLHLQHRKMRVNGVNEKDRFFQIVPNEFIPLKSLPKSVEEWKKIKKEPIKAYGYIVKKQIDRVKRKTVSIYRRLRNDT